ncbi:hypothetical protein EVG20_g10000 [Dentipellis fragilis]|uniref:Uncharacterized protein n=1 Tax=Dentipellis fragilis TaxID=205917 RepID=A0A4Y9XYP9_9AGAM|nr:hypothetical protein EVG20_g10000 [Dentipellis fragilis]
MHVAHPQLLFSLSVSQTHAHQLGVTDCRNRCSDIEGTDDVRAMAGSHGVPVRHYPAYGPAKMFRCQCTAMGELDGCLGRPGLRVVAQSLKEVRVYNAAFTLVMTAQRVGGRTKETACGAPDGDFIGDVPISGCRCQLAGQSGYDYLFL